MFKIRFIVRPIVCITYGANTALTRVNHWLHVVMVSVEL